MKARFAAAALLSVPLVAQVTHVVGPGGFAQIQDALAVALLDDTIVVQPGTYLPFTAGVGVRIVAPSGASVITPAQAAPWLSTTLQPPAGQTIYVSGLAFGQSGSLYPHVVYCLSGQCMFERCAFSPTHPFKSLYTLQCHHADMVLVSCTFSPFNGAVLVDGGSFAASDCAFFGVDPQVTMAQMPAAVTIRSSNAQLSFCSLQGGSSFNTGQVAGPGMRVEGNSTTTLVNCTVTGGDATSGSPPAAPGLVNLGAQPVRHLGSTFVGGWSRLTTNWGSWPVRGPGSNGAMQESLLLGMGPLPYGLRVGQSYGFVASSAPNTTVIYGTSFGLTPPTTVSGVQQLLRCDPAGTTLLAVGLTNGAGLDSRPVTWSLPAAALGTPLWVHGLAFDGAQFQASAPIGGLVH